EEVEDGGSRVVPSEKYGDEEEVIGDVDKNSGEDEVSEREGDVDVWGRIQRGGRHEDDGERSLRDQETEGGDLS
ncbi:hypothetical protein A2U01_0105047, partial [Trifolium medium]|nr:hypothetical protein [Trifolium medium]